MADVSQQPSSANAGAGAAASAPAATTMEVSTDLIPDASKHKLFRSWTIWELRKGDPSQGLAHWTDCPLPLYEFNTVEDFWLCWNKTPNITEVFERGNGVPPAQVERVETNARGQIVSKKTTTAQAYMLFVKGVKPLTEYESSPGVRVTKNRRRTELSVRATDFPLWWRAWEITVLAIIGEQIDPDQCIVGAYLTDKHSKNSVALRLEIWFSVESDEICDFIAEELRLLLKSELPELPFRFAKLAGRKTDGGNKGGRSGGGGGRH